MSLQNVQVELAEIILSDNLTTDQVNFPQRLQIYHNNVYSILTRTLEQTYPLIQNLVGDDFFRLIAKEYIINYPSRSGNVNDYGNYFDNFLAEFEPTKHLVYLPEVTQFEWTCHELATAADHTPFDMGDLSNIPSDEYINLTFVLNPACRVMKFHYPILDIIDLCQSKHNENVDIDAGGADLLLIRRTNQIALVPLSGSDYLFLSFLQEGKTLSEIIEIVTASDPTFRLHEKLPAWIRDNVIVDCYC